MHTIKLFCGTFFAIAALCCATGFDCPDCNVLAQSCALIACACAAIAFLKNEF